MCKLCRNLPSMGDLFTVFGASRPCGPAGWLALLLIKAGDVESNRGPTHTPKQGWIFHICHKQIHYRKISIRCNMIEHWVRRYPPSTIYRYLDLPSIQIIQTHNSHRHNTTPSLQTLVQALTHSPPTPPQPNTQTDFQHSPCCHKIGKSQT